MKDADKQAPLFPIVGIGASAGGLESFSRLLKEIPPDSGMAFVLIQHLDPTHQSYLREALVKTTQMPILEIKDGMEIEINHVYVIPPNFELDILHGALRLLPRDTESGVPHMPINGFFRSLAANCDKRAIGVVLSGTASDGTEGLRSIKDEGGFTFVENPATAKFPGMPESALRAGVVDYSLSIPELAHEILRLRKHRFYSAKEELEPFSNPEDQHDFERILNHLKNNLNIDFNEYKPATIKRRLVRRMALLRIDKLSRYLDFLRDDPAETKTLYEDVLIHVTSFFRDPEAYKSLQQNVFPDIMKNKQPNASVRMWAAGCSTGEEVYSLVIAFLEFLGDVPAKFPIQVFGSDISELMIEKARAGVYPEGISREVTPEILKKYFVRVDNGYRISKIVRDLCIFVRHDLARDPPFSRLDLITCRNVLIYFDHQLQKKIFSTFHYCLKQPGYLLLGRTENVTGHLQLFMSVDKANKIFARTSIPSQLRFQVPQQTAMMDAKVFERKPIEQKPILDVSKTVDNLLLTEYAPCGVLVNEQMEVLQFRGKTGQFLEQPPGEPETNLMKMVREGLFVELRMAFSKAQSEKKVVRKDGVNISKNGSRQLCNIVVHPFEKHPSVKENLFLILFEEVKTPVSDKIKSIFTRKLTKEESAEEELRSTRLEQELELTKEYLQSLNLEHQKTNDSLATANEELISGNEELQSMNEELETAKEELQSINEELTTVNDELQNSNHEVGLVNNDLINLLNSVEIPIVILDLKHNIRRFTPHARTIMNLLPSDIGRSIDDIKLNVDVKDLDKQIVDSIKNDIVKESEVQDREGRWYRIQIRPYKTLENKINGVVLSLVDINMLRRAVSIAEGSGDYARSIVEGIQLPLVVINEKLKVLSANKSFYKTFNVTKHETEQNLLYDLGINQWNIPSLKISLEEMITKNLPFTNIEVEREFPGIGVRIFLLSAQAISIKSETTGQILLAMEDITHRKHVSKEKELLLQRAEDAKRQLRIVADSVDVHLIHLDRNERFLFANKAASEMWGMRLEGMIGKTIAEVAGEETQKKLHPHTERVLRGESVQYEEQFTRKDGVVRTFLNTYSPGSRDAEGRVLDFVATGTDITDRKNDEEFIKKNVRDLAEEKDLRERFVAALSHDLRTPLTSSKMSAQMIIRMPDTSEKIGLLATRIVSSMERADTMIRDLLDADKIKAGEKLPLNIEECNLNSLVGKIVEELTILHGDRFTVKASDQIQGQWDQTAIRRIIENLASNAIKYGSTTSKVTIGLKQLDKLVEISVHNTGLTIPHEDQKNIFGHYQRTLGAAGVSEVGWGIGLALVRALTEAHKGRVSVKSTDQDGTVFSIILPIDDR